MMPVRIEGVSVCLQVRPSSSADGQITADPSEFLGENESRTKTLNIFIFPIKLKKREKKKKMEIRENKLEVFMEHAEILTLEKKRLFY